MQTHLNLTKYCALKNRKEFSFKNFLLSPFQPGTRASPAALHPLPCLFLALGYWRPSPAPFPFPLLPCACRPNLASPCPPSSRPLLWPAQRPAQSHPSPSLRSRRPNGADLLSLSGPWTAYSLCLPSLSGDTDPHSLLFSLRRVEAINPVPSSPAFMPAGITCPHPRFYRLSPPIKPLARALPAPSDLRF